jgi:hypothetical protein
MSLAMNPDEWLGFVRREYLESLVREGGSAAKFCVTRSESDRRALQHGLKQHASGLGFVFAEVDAARTRVHLVDQVFFQVAAQLDWDTLGCRVLAELLCREQLVAPAPQSRPFVLEAARCNQMDPKALSIPLRRRLTDAVFKRSDLPRDFRVAMFSLCDQLLAETADAEATGPIRDWLTGSNRNLSAVKPYGIYSRITRNNARHLLEALFKWVRICGYPGTIILIDIARLTIAHNPRDEFHYYTTAQLLDAYEVLRQFVDAIDRIEGAFFLVTADYPFLERDPWGRGIDRYEALKFRIYDEVRAGRPNPMASLVRICFDPRCWGNGQHD